MLKGKIPLLIEPDQIGFPEAYIIEELNETNNQQEYGYIMPPQFNDPELKKNNRLDESDLPSVIIIDL